MSPARRTGEVSAPKEASPGAEGFQASGVQALRPVRDPMPRDQASPSSAFPPPLLTLLHKGLTRARVQGLESRQQAGGLAGEK